MSLHEKITTGIAVVSAGMVVLGILFKLLFDSRTISPIMIVGGLLLFPIIYIYYVTPGNVIIHVLVAVIYIFLMVMISRRMR